MEELNVLEFLSYIKKHAVFVSTVTILITIIGLFYFMVLRKPEYTSTTSLTVTGTESSKVTTNDITLNSKMIPTYQEVITSRKVLDRVINNLKLNKSAAELAHSITIKATTDSLVLNITVVDSNRTVARDVANEVTRVFKDEIQEKYSIKNVEVLDEALASDNPSNINYAKSFVISFFAGLFFSVGILLLVFFLDNTVKSAEQISTKMEMVVLGAVPDYNTLSHGKKKGGKK